MNRAEYNDRRFDLLMRKVMPAPALVFKNNWYGYWNEWVPDAKAADKLIRELNSNSIIVFEDQRYETTQYASFIRLEYQSSDDSDILKVQLLDDQLQPLEAFASLKYNNEKDAWIMTITTSVLYANPDTTMNISHLSFDTFQIQDGIAGLYYAPEE